ncbi:hypothetical protein AB3N62_10955 [Leptospira sp. WS4.C2]
MKFWQLLSVFRDHKEELKYTLINDAWKNPYLEWYVDFENIVKNQKRDILDFEIPIQLALEVAMLLGNKTFGFLSINGWLRSYKSSENDIELTSYEIIDRFGLSVLEDVQEFGNTKILEK